MLIYSFAKLSLCRCQNAVIKSENKYRKCHCQSLFDQHQANQKQNKHILNEISNRIWQDQQRFIPNDL